MNCYPIYADICLLSVKRRLRTTDVHILIRKIEKFFNLPVGALNIKTEISGKPVKNIGGVHLSEIRRALYVYLLDEKNFTAYALAKILDIGHDSVIRGANKARGLMSVEDDRFIPYYNVVKNLAEGKEAIMPQPKKKERKKNGRKPSLSQEKQQEVIELFMYGGYSNFKLSVKMGVTRRTIYRITSKLKQAV